MPSAREENFVQRERTCSKPLRQMTMASERSLREAMCLGQREMGRVAHSEVGQVGGGQNIYGLGGHCWAVGFYLKGNKKPYKGSKQKVGVTMSKIGFFWPCVLVESHC